MKNLEIERLRGWAILTVMLAHSEGLREAIFPVAAGFYGASGVELFFVISGFVITQSLSRLLPRYSPGQGWLARLRASRGALMEFFTRRAFRILPMALLWSFPALFLVGLTNGAQFSALLERAYIQMGALLTLTFNYQFLKWNRPDLAHYWSLVVEEQFYLILPFLFICLPFRSGRIRAVISGILVIELFVRNLPVPRWVPPDNVTGYYHYTSHMNFDFLLLGVAVALLIGDRTFGRGLKFVSNRVTAQGSVLFLLVGLWFFPMYLPAVPDGLRYKVGFPLVGLLCALLVYRASLEKGEIPGFPPLGRWLEVLGSRSYGLYLIHPHVLRATNTVITSLGGHQAFPVAAPVVRDLAMFVISLALAEFCFRAFEGRLVRMGREISFKSPGAA